MIELSNSEMVRIRTLSLNIVRSIAEQHGGIIDKDLVADTVVVSVPEAQRDVCAQEIIDQLGVVRNYFMTLLVALLCGKVIVRISNN